MFPEPLRYETPGTSRRDFMKSTLVGAGLLAAGRHLSIAADSTAGPLHAPFLRMRLSLAAYSMRSLMQQNWPSPRSRKTKPEMDMDGFIDYCADLDLDGCELTSYYFPKVVSEEYFARLKIKALWNRLSVSGTAIGNNFCVPEGAARDKQLAMTRQWIDYATMMGAPVIRIFAGSVPKGDSEAAAIERCATAINESLEYAARKKIGLALENHGGITATPQKMMKIIQLVRPSPWFGVNFDSGNFQTDDPYRDLEIIAPYAINAQIKVTVRRNGQTEPADLPRTVAILKDAGYRGYVVLEYEERADPRQAIPRYIDQLRKLIDA